MDINAQRTQAVSEQQTKIKHYAKRMIFVTFQKEGIHAYPAAATDPKLEAVKYLASPHRHIFHFKIWIEVTHSNRDIEFILFKHFCEDLFSSGALKLDHKSCEMLSDDLYDEIATEYPNRDITIEVSEDNENGALINYKKVKGNYYDK